jgi:hypothetical protein
VSIVTPDGNVHSFITGLPSTWINVPFGANHVYFDDAGNLVILVGTGRDSMAQSLLLVDTTGFTPGDDPLGREAVHTVINIGDFIDTTIVCTSCTPAGNSNPYAMTFGTDGELFIADARANAVVRADSLRGALSILAEFPDLAYKLEAVPTGIDFDGEHLYVGLHSGAPYPSGGSRIAQVDMNGEITTLKNGLTTVVDLQLIPGGGGLVYLENNYFRPNTGGLYKLSNGEVTVLADKLDRPTGVRFGMNGEIFVTLLKKGQVIKVEGVATDVEDLSRAPGMPAQFILHQNYPNPFNPSTTIRYDLPEVADVRLVVFDALGRRVAELVNGHNSSGRHEAIWDATGSASGLYFYHLTAGDFVQTGAAYLSK